VNICIIPARGGSKRIPRKNIKDFRGRPMIGWSIKEAQESECFDRIIVSTDDEEIAEFSESCGVDVPGLRPPHLSGDMVSTGEVIAELIKTLHLPSSFDDNICCLYATAPFVLSSDICGSLCLLDRGGCDFVLPVTTYPFPIQRALSVKSSNGLLSMLDASKFSIRSQDLAEAVHDAGQFCWGTARAWKRGGNLFDLKVKSFNLPRWRVQDIDTPEDWEFAERLHMAAYG
jgi:pseudaminic acid cytidylyltransferase